MDAADVSLPYGLEFISDFSDLFDSAMETDSDGNQVMWYDQLRREIKKDASILAVWAWTAPESLGGEYVQIGDITLTSDLYTSVWGDSKLNF